MRFSKAVWIIAGFALFLASAFMLFEPGNDPTGFFVYTPSLAVLNPENDAAVGEELEIEFMTKGEKELSVSASKGDVDFLGLECGGRKIEIDPSKSITYGDYGCKENSKIALKVLSQEAEVTIRFGSDSQIAKNSAS